MNSKTMCLMGTYLGFMLVIRCTSMLMPQLALIITPLSWGVSAAYLYFMPFKDWVKSRVLVELSKLDKIYEVGLSIYNFELPYIYVAVDELIAKYNPSIEVRNHVYSILEPVTLASTILVMSIFLSATYIMIWLTHRELARIDFFRRIMI